MASQDEHNVSIQEMANHSILSTNTVSASSMDAFEDQQSTNPETVSDSEYPIRMRNTTKASKISPRHSCLASFVLDLSADKWDDSRIRSESETPATARSSTETQRPVSLGERSYFRQIAQLQLQASIAPHHMADPAVDDFIHEFAEEQATLQQAIRIMDEQQCEAFFLAYFDMIQRNPYSPIDASEKLQAIAYCQTVNGQVALSNVLESKRNRAQLAPGSFYHLSHLMVIALRECFAAKQYFVSKNFMNMSFTFYHIKPGTDERVYLYSDLMDEPIWQSKAFWEYAFFLALKHERRHLTPINVREASDDERAEFTQFELFTFFGQLSAFISNMTVLKVNRSLVDTFLTKMALIGDVPTHMIDSIKTTTRRNSPVVRKVTLNCDPFFKFGFSVELDESNNFVVDNLTWFGSAYRSEQVHVGDYLLQIDGTEISGLTLPAVEALLEDKAVLFSDVMFLFGR